MDLQFQERLVPGEIIRGAWNARVSFESFSLFMVTFIVLTFVGTSILLIVGSLSEGLTGGAIVGALIFFVFGVLASGAGVIFVWRASPGRWLKIIVSNRRVFLLPKNPGHERILPLSQIKVIELHKRKAQPIVYIEMVRSESDEPRIYELQHRRIGPLLIEDAGAFVVELSKLSGSLVRQHFGFSSTIYYDPAA